MCSLVKRANTTLHRQHPSRQRLEFATSIVGPHHGYFHCCRVCHQYLRLKRIAFRVRISSVHYSPPILMIPEETTDGSARRSKRAAVSALWTAAASLLFRQPLPTVRSTAAVTWSARSRGAHPIY
jgi:hypothetical protein